MAINILLLKDAINELFLAFKGYFNLTYSIQSKTWDYWNNQENVGLYSEIKDLEISANEWYRKICSEVEWNISQHHPAANNLRFFLAVLMSVKDLERFADYGYSVASLIKKYGSRFRPMLGDFYIFEEMLKTIQEMWERMLKDPGKLNCPDFIECKELKLKFVKNHGDYFSRVNKIVEKPENLSVEDKEAFLAINLLSVRIDRSVDHVFNVLENFAHVQNPSLEEEIF